ncbi:DNA-binding protein [Pseudoflavonifractor sp. SW1122]|uniref:DNA-processing protein DprA n=1 Tax=unclassified Pseudoflavonifractor TaxID=2628103 RepID=UPI000B39EB44|nr:MULTISPECIES: DNA-processing protein DprA [unclassified Pseudoflavonifractor]NJE74897.1 DNA-binding protein [Pseudoflavonifractor sp. SW1122]OUN21940.1 DNA-binding protein [Pseudoflavonifractor sp. An85]
MDARVLQVAFAKGVGDVALKKYLHYIHDHCVEQESYLSDEVFRCIGFSVDMLNSIKNTEERAKSVFEKLCLKDVEIITETSNDYPQYLKRMLQNKCPPLLFARGNKRLLSELSVGFCGSRKVSDKGMAIATNCTKQLVEKNVTIISGYAAGTDLTVHKAALENEGSTIFVLSEGILQARIKKQIAPLLNDKNHLFISQFLPELTWNAGNAMKRNSTIIGLSRAMILVESRLEGGTFAAGEEALRVNCPLFVIDFSKPDTTAEANPYFISKGGIPIRGKNGIPNMKKVFSSITSEQRLNDNASMEQLQIDM